jgi:hypothetical protein
MNLIFYIIIYSDTLYGKIGIVFDVLNIDAFGLGLLVTNCVSKYGGILMS